MEYIIDTIIRIPCASKYKSIKSSDILHLLLLLILLINLYLYLQCSFFMLTVPHLFCFVSVERVALSAKEPLMQTTEQVPKKPQTASHTSY